jgi:hypothetical protein
MGVAFFVAAVQPPSTVSLHGDGARRRACHGDDDGDGGGGSSGRGEQSGRGLAVDAVDVVDAAVGVVGPQQPLGVAGDVVNHIAVVAGEQQRRLAAAPPPPPAIPRRGHQRGGGMAGRAWTRQRGPRERQF